VDALALRHHSVKHREQRRPLAHRVKRASANQALQHPLVHLAQVHSLDHIVKARERPITPRGDERLGGPLAHVLDTAQPVPDREPPRL